MVGEDFFEIGEGGGVFEHGKFAMGVAGIISGAEFNGIDLERLEFF